MMIAHAWSYLVRITFRNGLPELEPEAPQPADAWIPWWGGKCPVPGQIVDVVFRDGHCEHRGKAYSWQHCNSNTDIVLYRLSDRRTTPDRRGPK
jgi:hypothetical protein